MLQQYGDKDKCIERFEQMQQQFPLRSLHHMTNLCCRKQLRASINRGISEESSLKHPCIVLVIAWRPLSSRHNLSTPSSSCERALGVCVCVRVCVCATNLSSFPKSGDDVTMSGDHLL